MNKLFFIIAVMIGLTSTTSYANVYINQYWHVPCESWSFSGACNFRGTTTKGAEATSVQRAVFFLADRIEELEKKIEAIEFENKKLKEELRSK